MRDAAKTANANQFTTCALPAGHTMLYMGEALPIPRLTRYTARDYFNTRPMAIAYETSLSRNNEGASKHTAGAGLPAAADGDLRRLQS